MSKKRRLAGPMMLNPPHDDRVYSHENDGVEFQLSTWRYTRNSQGVTEWHVQRDPKLLVLKKMKYDIKD